MENELNVREQQVTFLFERLREEGSHLDERDRIILNTYVRGSISGVDMLAHACQFPDVTSYRNWMLSGNTWIGQKCRFLSVEQVLEEFYRLIKIRSLESSLTL